MARAVGLKLGKLAMAAAGALGMVTVFQRATTVIPFTDLGGHLRLAKQLLKPPYIYLFFNLILFCLLSSSFWASSFNSLHKKLQSSFKASQQRSTVVVSPNTPSDQVIIAHLTSHVYSSLFDDIWHRNFDQLKDDSPAELMKQSSAPEEEPTKVEQFNQKVPLDHVSREIQREKNGSTLKNAVDSPDGDEYVDGDEKKIQGIVTEQVIVTTGDEDEEIGFGEDQEGDDMNSMWNAIMEGKKKAMEEELEKNNNTWEVTPRADVENSTSNHSKGEKEGRDPAKPELKKSWNVQEGGDQEGGKRWSKGRGVGVGVGRRVGWRRMEVVMSQDELYHRAEAFISKFKYNIQLQRLESYQRFLDMINGGGTR